MYPGYFYVPVTVWGKGPRCNFLKNALGVDLKFGRHRGFAGINLNKNLDLKHIYFFNDLDSCTSLGGINIRMLGFVIQVRIYTF